jgi:hypothetical protein
MYGRLFFLTTPDPGRPIEETYIAEIDIIGSKSFVTKEEALLFLFDNGVKTRKRSSD